MQIPEVLLQLYNEQFGTPPLGVCRLTSAGSPREYYLLENTRKGVPFQVVGTIGPDIAENERFIYLSHHFTAKHLPVPEVIAASANHAAYLQTYLGNCSLMQIIEGGRTPSGNLTEEARHMVLQAITMLPHIQFEGADGLQFNHCHQHNAMDSTLIANDLNYFKYCFLKPSGQQFCEQTLDVELSQLHDIYVAEASKATSFMVRDFQSRNVMVHDGRPWLIDFQGGMRGPCHYDVASFVWQAKAAFDDKLKKQLIDAYIEEARAITPVFDIEEFSRNLPASVLLRLLQTLGAYGFRGLTERKAHFLQSLPQGVANLQRFFSSPINNHFARFAAQFPVIARIANQLSEAPAVRDIAPLAALQQYDGLTLTISSFSFKRGVPYDLSGNGGGFVFDCRAVHNPGRYDQYKNLTGRDKPVIEFLEKQTDTETFARNCFELIEKSVDRYLSRGFTSLAVAFGCTGGQHRSVYFAEKTAHAIASRFPMVRVVIHHREQQLFETIQFQQK